MASTPASLTVRAFLRMRASSVYAPNAQRGFVLALGDTTGLFADGLTAQWLGPEAAAFYDKHAADLVPGRCVDVELYHFKAHNPTELRARIARCELAPLPASWLKHASQAAES